MLIPSWYYINKYGQQRRDTDMVDNDRGSFRVGNFLRVKEQEEEWKIW